MTNPADEKFFEGSFLSDEFIRQLVAVGEVDLLVGIPTLNDSKTIKHVVQAVQVGYAKYFPRERAVLINADGGSRDGTQELFESASIDDPRRLLTAQTLRTVHRISTRYRGAPGTAAALRTIIAAADLLRAKACAVVSPDLVSMNPLWVDNLLRPVYKENFDFVAPLYRRHKFDGLLMSNLIYPLARTAYGRRIREPLAGEFGFSGRLAGHLLEQGFWREDGTMFSAEMWVTTLAILGDFRVCQSVLGPKVHGSKGGGQDLVGTIRQAVGALFRSMVAQESYWLAQTGSEPISTFGFPYDVTLEPVRVNRKRMLQMFRTGISELASILQSILAEETLGAVQQIAALPDEDFRYPDELWVKTVYDFASAYRRSVINRDHIVQTLTPLYRGRLSSFVMQNHEAEAEEVDKAVETLCLEYERLKPYLIDRWNAKK